MGGQINRGAALAAAGRILERRLVHGRPDDVARLPDDADLAGVVRYVRGYRAVPVEVLQADGRDALLIVDHLEARIPADRYALALLLRESGLTLRQLAGPLHVRTDPSGGGARQAVMGALRRLAVAAAGGDKDAAMVRAQGRRQGARQAAAMVGQDARVIALVARLRGYGEQLGATAVEDLDDMAATLERLPAGAAVPAELVNDLRILLRWLRPELAAGELGDLVTHALAELGDG